MFAFSALATMIAGFSLWRSATKETQPESAGRDRVVETKRLVLLDSGGRRGASVAMSESGLDLVFYNAAGARWATLGGSMGRETTVQLYDQAERVGASVWASKGASALSLDVAEGGASATLEVSQDRPSLRINGPGVFGAGKDPATATLDISNNKPALWLSPSNGCTVQLQADQDSSSLTLHDTHHPRVILDTAKKSSGLTVYGEQGTKMSVSATIFKDKKGVLWPSIDITDADGRALFEKP